MKPIVKIMSFVEKEILSQFEKQPKIKDILLCGSRATNTHQKDSDYDLLYILDTTAFNSFEFHGEIEELRLEVRFMKENELSDLLEERCFYTIQKLSEAKSILNTKTNVFTKQANLLINQQLDQIVNDLTLSQKSARVSILKHYIKDELKTLERLNEDTIAFSSRSIEMILNYISEVLFIKNISKEPFIDELKDLIYFTSKKPARFLETNKYSLSKTTEDFIYRLDFQKESFVTLKTFLRDHCLELLNLDLFSVNSQDNVLIINGACNE